MRPNLGNGNSVLTMFSHRLAVKIILQFWLFDKTLQFLSVILIIWIHSKSIYSWQRGIITNEKFWPYFQIIQISNTRICISTASTKLEKVLCCSQYYQIGLLRSKWGSLFKFKFVCLSTAEGSPDTYLNRLIICLWCKEGSLECKKALARMSVKQTSSICVQANV